MKRNRYMRLILLAIPLLAAAIAKGNNLPQDGLILDLDAAKGVVLEDGDQVAAWRNQVATSTAKEFVKQDKGRKVVDSGRPLLRKEIPALHGKPALVFRQQELVCPDEDRFDKLTTGSGHTWLAILAVHEQRVGLKDVNAFFGNLRNGGRFEGVWGGLNDDNTLWWGARNAITLGRFDVNNPQVIGPKLETGTFHLICGRMAAGTGIVKLELFAGDPKAVAEAEFPVNPNANPSRMTIGQERDAIEHPGYESFDGEIARFLIWERPLTDVELNQAISFLRKSYLTP